jgi:hypothetical protein
MHARRCGRLYTDQTLSVSLCLPLSSLRLPAISIQAGSLSLSKRSLSLARAHSLSVLFMCRDVMV